MDDARTTPDTRSGAGAAAPSGPARPRLEVPARTELDDDQRALHEAVTGGRRSAGPALFALQDEQGRLLGPFGPLLLSPALGHAVQALGVQVRYGTALTDRVRELAILVVAAAEDSAYERYAHEAVGRSVGLDDDQLADLRAGSVPVLDDETERTAVTTARALCRHDDLDDEQWTQAVQHLGRRGVFELVTLVGYYRMLALQLRVHRIAAPGG